MAGQIKKMLDQIIDTRSHGDRTIALTTRTKLCLKGISPDKFDGASYDDPAIIVKVKEIAKELGVAL